MKEPIMEPILRWFRIGRVLPFIQQHINCVLLDIGCGFNCRLLKTVEPYISHGFGIDFKVNEISGSKLTAIKSRLDEKLPFEDMAFDIVTMLAVLEHLDKPSEIISEIERVLKPKGKLIITVPSRRSKPILEFLSYKLGIVNKLEIRDHKKYYDYSDLSELFSGTGLKIEQHKYFQMGMNNFLVLTKAGHDQQASREFVELQVS
jgi:2-polyprenyl-3-methyl-5-hydroxy-6-metoxy-1,4-benzoquinol methylase